MNLFYKRPLCLILCVMLGGFAFYANGSVAIKTALWICPILILAYTVFSEMIFKRRDGFLKILALLLLLSCVASHLYFSKKFEFSNAFSGESEISGTVYDLDKSSNGKATLLVEVDKIGQTEISGSRKLLLKVARDDAAYMFNGADVRFTATLSNIENSGDFDSKSYYYARGISAVANDYTLLDVSKKEGTSFSESALSIRDKVARQSMLTMGAEAGSLFSAVFMGERSFLSPELSLDFNRTGISHILALSGMHLAILSLGITKLLSLIGVSKKPRTVLIIALILAYMTLTGFSVSVVRAGIMLIVSSLLYLFASAKDLPTNLAIAVFVICLTTPYAVFDTSLWLSAFATFGIVSMSEFEEPYDENKRLIVRFFKWLGTSFAASFFAISATMLISASLSPSISLVGALATFIVSFLVEIFIYVGILMLALGFILPIGSVIMYPIYFSIRKITSALSYPDFVVASIDEVHTKILLIIFTLLFFLFIICRIKRIKAAIIFLVCAFVCTHASAAITTYADIYADGIIYERVGKHEVFTLKSENNVSVLDVTSYSDYTAYETVEILNAQNVFTVDNYIISHYTFGLDDNVKNLISRIKTRAVLLPAPKNEDETAIFELVKASVKDFATEIHTYHENSEILLGGIKLKQTYRSTYNDGENKTAFKICFESKCISYLSSGMLHYTTRDLAHEMMSDSETVIFGSYGQEYEPSYLINKSFDKTERIIISGNKIAFTTESEEFYRKRGVEILNDPDTVSIIR